MLNHLFVTFLLQYANSIINLSPFAVLGLAGQELSSSLTFYLI